MGAPEYEIVWDGSHHGVNADLLAVPHPTEPRQAPRSPRAGETPDAIRILHLLEQLAPRPLTAIEIAAVSGLAAADGTVRNALARLRVAGLVEGLDVDPVPRLQCRHAGRLPRIAYRARSRAV